MKRCTWSDGYTTSAITNFGIRNIIRLTAINEVPTNSTLNQNYNTSNASPKISIKFEYSHFDPTQCLSGLISASGLSSIATNIRTSGGCYILNKVTDQLGGITDLDYSMKYGFSKSLNAQEIQSILSPTDPSIWRRIPDNVIEYNFAVVKKTIHGNGTNQIWDFDYGSPTFDENNSKIETAHLPNKHKDVVHDSPFGFASTTMFLPVLSGSSGRSSIKYYYYTDVERFGKQQRIEKYSDSNTLISVDSIIYVSDTAFCNARFRFSKTKQNLSSGQTHSEYYDYTTSYYPNASNLYLGLITYDSNSPFSYQFYESSHYRILETLSDTLRYLSSYFVRKAHESHTDFTYTRNWKYDLASQSPGQYVARHLQVSQETNGSNSSSYQSKHITTMTDYEYWSANNYGQTSCYGFKNSIIGWKQDNTLNSWPLVYEPSWQIYKVITWSPETPGYFKSKRYYYYFDLYSIASINVDGAPASYSDLGQYERSMPNRFDGLYYSRKNYLRDIVYEVRESNGIPGNDIKSRSTYYIYDSNNNSTAEDNIDQVNRIISFPPTYDFAGSACNPLNPSTNNPGNPDNPTDPGVFVDPGEVYHSGSSNRMNAGYELNACLNYKYTALQASDEMKYSYVRTLADYPSSGSQYTFHYLVNDVFTPGIDEPILEWGPRLVDKVDGSGGQDICIVPKFPFDTLVTKQVEQYTKYGQVRIERDAAGVHTRYYYKPIINYWNTDPALNCTYSSYHINDFGRPYAKTVGYEMNDSLRTNVEYFPGEEIKKVTDPNGATANWEYDDFSRMVKAFKNNKLVGVNSYHYSSSQSSFLDKTANNYVETNLLLNENTSNVLRLTTYIDPKGRTYGSITGSAANSSSPLDPTQQVVYAGCSDYDEWDRSIRDYKPQNLSSAAGFNGFQSIISAFQSYKQNKYENNPNSRLVQVFDYGESSHAKSTTYTLINAVQLCREVGMNALAQFADPNSFFWKIVVSDEDRKAGITYKDAFGNVICTKNYISGGDYNVVKFQYDNFDNLTQSLTSTGTIQSFKYNILGRNYYKNSTDGGAHYFMYNRAGQVVLEKDANGINSNPQLYRKYTYDTFGRLLKQEKLPVNTSTCYGVGPLGDAVASPFQLPTVGNTLNLPYLCSQYTTESDYIPSYYDINIGSSEWLYKRYSTNCSGNIVKTTDYNVFLNSNASITEKEFAYDHIPSSAIPCANLNSNYLNTISNLKGRLAFSATYNSGNSKVQERYYSYNNEGNLSFEAEQFNNSGITSSNVNNAATTLVNVILYEGYDLQNHLLTETIDHGATTNIGDKISFIYDYDPMSKLRNISIKSPALGGTPSSLCNFQYDYSSGNVIQIMQEPWTSSNNINTYINFDYDVRNRLTSIQGRDKNGTTWLGYFLNYDANKPGKFISDTSFTAKGTKNFNGNINYSETKLVLNGNVNFSSGGGDFEKEFIYGYRYDGLNRLVAADCSNFNILASLDPSTPNLMERTFGDEIMTYDKIGNIQTLKRGVRNASMTYSVDAMSYNYQNSNRLQSIGSRTFTYDDNGNMNSDSWRKISGVNYGFSNLVTNLNKIDNSNVNHQVSYLYNGTDKRIYKEDLSGANTNIKNYYLIDQFGNEIEEYDYLSSVSTQRVNYIYGNGIRVARLQNVVREFYLYDHLGNMKADYSLDYTGDIDVKYFTELYPFGKTLRNISLNSSSANYIMNLHQRDQETQWDYFFARNYDSEIGRFLSVDPHEVKSPQLSSFSFLADNPINLIDPDGRDVIRGQRFLNSTYNKVYEDLVKNNSAFNKMIEKYIRIYPKTNKNRFDYKLNVDDSRIPPDKGGITFWNYYPDGASFSTRANASSDFPTSNEKGEITLWHYYIVIHEALHAEAALYPKISALENPPKNPSLYGGNLDHKAYNAMIDKAIAAFTELSSDLNLGLDASQCKELALYGTEGSEMFSEYIDGLVKANHTDYKTEFNAYINRIHSLISQVIKK